MSDNVASLGFEVDSKPIKDATQDLKGLGEQATKTSESVGKLQPSMQTLEATSRRAGASVDELKSRASAFNAVSDKLASSTKSAGTALGTIAKEAATIAPALGAVAAASSAVTKENEAHSSSLGNLRNNLRGMSPLLNQFGGGLGDILQYSKAARLGLEGLAVVAGGAALVALAKVNDEVERAKRSFAALTGSQEQGNRSLNAVKESAKSSAVEFGAMSSAVSQAAQGFDKLQNRSVIYANTGDRLTKFTEDLAETFGTLGKAMQTSGATAEEEAKVLGALASSIKTTGGLTVETFQKIRDESLPLARTISEAFGFRDIAEFQSQLAKTPITAKELIDRIRLVKPAIEESFNKEPIVTVGQSIEELNAEWKNFVKTLSETGTIGLVKDALKGLGVGIREISDNLPGLKSQFDSAANATKSWGDIIKVVEDKNSLFGKAIEVDIGAAITKYIDFMSQGAQSAFNFEKAIVSAMGGALTAVGSFAATAGKQLAAFADSAVQAAVKAASAMASIARGGSGGAAAGNTNPMGDVMGGDGGGPQLSGGGDQGGSSYSGSSSSSVPTVSSGGFDTGSIDYGGGSADYGYFATGGQFTVGGDGGTDTTKVSFRATKGEVVTVSTPDQMAQTSTSSGVQGLTATPDQSAVGVVSATPDPASLATVKEITDAIDKSTIDITKKVLEGSDNIVSALNKLTGGVAATTVNPSTGLPVSSGSSAGRILSEASFGGGSSGGGGGFSTRKSSEKPSEPYGEIQARDFYGNPAYDGGTRRGQSGGVRGFRGDNSFPFRNPVSTKPVNPNYPPSGSGGFWDPMTGKWQWGNGGPDFNGGSINFGDLGGGGFPSDVTNGNMSANDLAILQSLFQSGQSSNDGSYYTESRFFDQYGQESGNLRLRSALQILNNLGYANDIPRSVPMQFYAPSSAYGGNDYEPYTSSYVQPYDSYFYDPYSAGGGSYPSALDSISAQYEAPYSSFSDSSYYPSGSYDAGYATSSMHYGGGSYDYGYFATGGKFTVDGDGGTDTTKVSFNATKGETVQITPAGVANPVSSSPTIGDPSQSSASSTMTKNVIINVQAGIQAESFIKSRAQIARGI